MNAPTKKLNRKIEIEENFIIKCTVVFQSLSRVLVTPWTAARQASLSFTISRSYLKLMSIQSVMLLNHLVLCRPLFFLHSNFLCMSLFHWVGSSHQVAKGLELQFQHPCFQWISGLISLALTCLIPLLSKGLSSLFQATQFENINLRCSAFLMVQLSHPHVTAGKTVVLII